MSAKRYESKQQQIFRPARDIYMTVYKMSNFTPVLGDKVEGWWADDDNCKFTAKGMNFALKIANREENKLVKIVPGEGGINIPFTFWFQLKQVTDNDTRIRLVLDIELNFMLKTMIGGKIQSMIDKIAETIAMSFNNPENIDPNNFKF